MQHVVRIEPPDLLLAIATLGVGASAVALAMPAPADVDRGWRVAWLVLGMLGTLAFLALLAGLFFASLVVVWFNRH